MLLIRQLTRGSHQVKREHATVALFTMAMALSQHVVPAEFKCVASKVSGADTSNENIATNFIPRAEYRIVDVDTVRDEVAEEYRRVINCPPIEEETTAFDCWHVRRGYYGIDPAEVKFMIRNVKDDPLTANNWGICKGPKTNFSGEHLWCDLYYHDYLRVDWESKRFIAVNEGGWIRSGTEGDDATFRFGTCSPYYD